jgi:hypothetical protein
MEIVAALFIENVNFRQDPPGGPTRIDITGAYFSTKLGEFPATLTPHLLVLLRAESEEGRSGTVDVRFVRRDSGDEVGRHRQPQMISPPGQFFYQLVRPELSFDEPGTIDAHCEIPETGSTIVVPLTALP